MTCPKCCQPIGQPTAEGACPLCGFDLRPFRQRLRALYTLTTSFFSSTLVYCGLVSVLDLNRHRHESMPPKDFMTYSLLVLAVLVFGAAVKVGQRLATTTSMEQLQRLFTVKMAMNEAIVVFGLVIYFVFWSVPWFVIFLALCLIGFVQTALQMPAVAEQLARLAVLAESTTQGDGGH